MQPRVQNEPPNVVNFDGVGNLVNDHKRTSASGRCCYTSLEESDRQI